MLPYTIYTRPSRSGSRYKYASSHSSSSPFFHALPCPFLFFLPVGPRILAPRPSLTFTFTMVILPFSLFISLTSAFATFAGASSPPRLSRRILHERRNALPSGWALHRRADPDAIVPLSIALRQSNLENLDGYLFDVADPASPNYGQLWTASRVAKTFRPSKQSIDAVHSWLVDDGMDLSRVRLSKDGGYVHLNVSVSEAERLLAAEYYVYKHADSGVEHVGCHRGYHLPEHITAHVDLITPTVEFGGVQLGAQIAKRSSARAATPAADSGDKGHMYKPNGAPKQTVPWKVCCLNAKNRKRRR